MATIWHREIRMTHDDGVTTIVVPGPAGEVQVEITDDQALQIARFLNKAIKKPRKLQVPTEHFDAFWRLYPADKRFDRKGMEHKWSAEKLDSKWEVIERHLRLKIPNWASDGNRWCPLVRTYLNQRYWEVLEDVVEQKIV